MELMRSDAMAPATGPQPGAPAPALLPPPAATPTGGLLVEAAAPPTAARNAGHTARVPRPEHTDRPNLMELPPLQSAPRTPAHQRLGPRSATSTLANRQDAGLNSPAARPADNLQPHHPQRRLPSVLPGPTGRNSTQPRGATPVAATTGNTPPAAALAPHNPSLPDLVGLLQALPPGALLVWNAPPAEPMAPEPAAPVNMLLPALQQKPVLTHPIALRRQGPLLTRPPPVANPTGPRGPPPQRQLPPKRRKQQALQACESAPDTRTTTPAPTLTIGKKKNYRGKRTYKAKLARAARQAGQPPLTDTATQQHARRDNMTTHPHPRHVIRPSAPEPHRTPQPSARIEVVEIANTDGDEEEAVEPGEEMGLEDDASGLPDEDEDM